MTIAHMIRKCKIHGDIMFAFQRSKNRWYCMECSRKQLRESSYRRGIHTPMKQSKNSSSYLGVYIAERILQKQFNNVSQMPYGNKGYDYICGKGFKIDVKSSCLLFCNNKNKNGVWSFGIKNNTIADYFLCLAFDNRTDLNPQHVWLIPGKDINYLKVSLTIANTTEGLLRLSKYEKSLNNAIKCCNSMKIKNHQQED
jgi:hypothetical protein